MIERKLASGAKGCIALQFLLLLCSSCAPSAAGWQLEHCRGAAPSFRSQRFFLPPANEFENLELEMVSTPYGLRLYLNVFGLEVPHTEGDVTLSEVSISFRERSYTFLAHRFQGGQRLLVPNDVLNDIIQYVQEGQRVALQVGRYRGEIIPEKFMIIFNKMISFSSVSGGWYLQGACS